MSLHRWSRFLSTIPWFVERPAVPQSFIQNSPPNPSIPHHAPQILKLLHSQLLQLPHLDKSTLSVGPAVPPPPGPLLSQDRGSTFSGESAYDMPYAGLWSWVVVAQVSYFSKYRSLGAHGINIGERRHGKQRRNRLRSTRCSKSGGDKYFMHCDIRLLTRGGYFSF